MKTGKPIRVLVVDDNAGIRGRITALVEADVAGAACVAAASLAEARAALDAGHHDVLLLDMQLPDADGLEGLLALRALRPALPIVIVSGAPADHYEDAVLAAGAAGFVSKHRIDERLAALIVSLVPRR